MSRKMHRSFRRVRGARVVVACVVIGIATGYCIMIINDYR